MFKWIARTVVKAADKAVDLRVMDHPTLSDIAIVQVKVEVLDMLIVNKQVRVKKDKDYADFTI